MRLIMALTPSYRSFTVHPLTGTFAMLPLIDMVNHSATSFNAKVTPYDEDRMALDGGKAQARSKAHQAHLFLGRLVAVRPGAEALAFLLSWSGPWGIKARLLSCRLYGTGYCNYMRRRCLLCVFGWPLVVSQQATHGHVDRHGWGIPIFLLHGTVTKNIDVTTYGHYSLLSLRRDSSHE